MDEVRLKIAERLSPSGAEQLRRIDDLSSVARREEYMEFCSRIDEGRKAGKCNRGDAILAKDAMAQVYNQPTPFSIGKTLDLASKLIIAAAVAGVVGYTIYQQILQPTIEYFSR